MLLWGINQAIYIKLFSIMVAHSKCWNNNNNKKLAIICWPWAQQWSELYSEQWHHHDFCVVPTGWRWWPNDYGEREAQWYWCRAAELTIGAPWGPLCTFRLLPMAETCDWMWVLWWSGPTLPTGQTLGPLVLHQRVRPKDFLRQNCCKVVLGIHEGSERTTT